MGRTLLRVYPLSRLLEVSEVAVIHGTAGYSATL